MTKKEAVLIVASLVLIACAFSSGVIIGRSHDTTELQSCQQANATLQKDLSYAVVRGVICDANLILCRQGR